VRPEYSLGPRQIVTNQHLQAAVLTMDGLLATSALPTDQVKNLSGKICCGTVEGSWPVQNV
jgi:hypothetical protein